MNYPKGTSLRRWLLACFCIVSIVAPQAADAQAQADGDTLRSREALPAARASEGIPFALSSFDTLSHDQILQLHSYSFDHLLETVPGFVVNRAGPIGADALFSRFGMGAGRGTVYMAGIPINDPQSDVVPFALIPMSTMDRLVFNHSSKGQLFGRAGLEGSVDILELQAEPDKPYAAFELSKGTNDLRQRRVRFSSPQSAVGIDLGYDELLNDGYSYDPETGAVDFGRSVSRFQTMNLRGELPSGESYFFSFRGFKDVFKGQLADLDGERRRSGHYAVASARVNGWRFSLFEKNYDVSLPDSQTSNHTTALYTRVTPVKSDRLQTELGIGMEDIHADQVVGGVVGGKRRVRLGSAGGQATIRAWRNVKARFEGALGHHYRGKTGWGGRVILSVPLFSSHEISINGGRSFRLPNLGERFLPLHTLQVGGVDKIVGNRYLDPEVAWEAGVRFKSKIGFLQSEMRFTEIRVEDAITFLPVARQDETWLMPANGDEQQLRFFEGRWNAGRSFYGIKLGLAGGAVYAVGDREGFFANVPETRVDASFSVSRDLFQSTSGISFLTEYQYTSARRAFPGGDSPAYGILNLKLVARLLDANLYLQWLNAFDENYRTIGPLMLTPRTLVYGVQWTIFN